MSLPLFKESNSHGSVMRARAKPGVQSGTVRGGCGYWPLTDVHPEEAGKGLDERLA